MKRCPECRRDYYDDTLLYCLDDGSALDGPASGSGKEPETMHLPAGDESSTALLPSLANPDTAARSGNRRYLGLALLILVPVLIGAGFIAYRYLKPANTQPRAIQVERLTTNGRATTAAISPDGKFYVYTVDEGAKHSLWVRQLAASSNVQIIPAAEDVYYWGIGFTPDSTHINFVKVQFEKNVHWSLFQMPVLGGTQKKILEDADGGLGYSPDGKQIAYLRAEYPNADESSLILANADGTNERILASRKAPDVFPSRGRIPAWSADGKTIACIIGDDSDVVGRMDVVEVSVSDGTVTPVKTQLWASITQIAWLKEKSGLLIVGVEKESKAFQHQLWSFSYPAGESRRITTDFNDYLSISLTADLSALVTVQSNTITNIWSVPNNDAARAVQIRSGGSNDEGVAGLAIAPDGRIVFNSMAGGVNDVWIMKADGTGAKQLSTDAGASVAAPSTVTPDGRYVIFLSLNADKLSLYRMNLDGGDVKQLAGGSVGFPPASVTPDSGSVIYTSITGGNPYLSKIPIDGGQPVQLSTSQASFPVVSPDGKWIVCAYRKDSNSTWRYAIIPIDGGEPTKVFDLIGNKGNFVWSADGQSLLYLRDTDGGITNIWSMPLDDKPVKQITNFKTDQIYNFVLTRDGKQTVLSRGTTTSDVVLIKDFH